MYLVAIAWIYVTVLMALAEGFSGSGSWLGAAITLLLYGALPLAIALYLWAAPARRRARRRAAAASATGGAADPDGGAHAAGDAVAAKGKEP
jgi:Kef-type K+ transport system membrane component KefB